MVTRKVYKKVNLIVCTSMACFYLHLQALFGVSAASFGKNVAVLDFVNPSPRGE